jgi:hypothetical protein
VLPNSTAPEAGETDIPTSLETVTLALLDFVLSAWLVAVTCIVPPGGKSAGAIYKPSAVIVPT